MIPRPPRSTLFPSRRSSDLTVTLLCELRKTEDFLRCTISAVWNVAASHALDAIAPLHLSLNPLNRSEEHTSELQSRRDLVCRLLLEKKKKTTVDRTRDTQTR